MIISLKPLRLVVLTVVHIVLFQETYGQSKTHYFTQSVISGIDDVEEFSSGKVYANSSDLELVYDNATSGNQTVGIRFTNITIPANAIINKAYIQFKSIEVTTGTCNLTIQGQAIDHAPAFTTTNFNVSSRSRTNAKINWSPPGWNLLNASTAAQATPEIKNVIQEIVNRTGWRSGNAMVFMFTGTGKRNAYAYEKSAADAPSLVVEYALKSGPFPVTKNSVWKYHDRGIDLGTGWTAAGYNDSNWKLGPGVLGYGDPVATTLRFGTNSTNKYPSSYMRHSFSVDDPTIYDNLIFNIRRDDGAVVYLNGVEQFRANMPTGSVSYGSTALSTVAGSDETKYFTFRVPATNLRKGINVLAVSVHQDKVNSSDLTFDMEVKGELRTIAPNLVLAEGAFPVQKNSVWRYNDLGKDLGTSWTAPNYDHSSWKSGAGVLGYGDPVSTTLNFGPNSTDKYLTYYFRHAFNVENTSLYQNIIFNIRRDDGAVVYLNGVEQFRTNMPTGPLTFNSKAVTYVNGNDETRYHTFKVPVTQLKNGLNVVAVSVHQDRGSSSDMTFDMEVKGELKSLNSFNCDPNSSDKIGCFISIRPGAQQERFVFPESHTFQQLIKSGVSRYTSRNAAVRGGNDFTAFIPKNGSSRDGYLSINHENSPGGVSILHLNFNELKNLWQVNEIHDVNFSSVVKTDRNCSGGITPWGTVITSEETVASGDANGDGYQDVGWNVEIDPVTRKIKDYDGDGKPDKLWAMGRMSHENVAVGKDGITVYQGEDGGSSCLYKFVASRKGNLSAGTLFVLRRSTSNPTIGEWIRVPNTTKTERNNTSNLAASLGGTNWRNIEDVEFGPDGKIYFTSKINGIIWRFNDNGSTVSNIEAWVTNQDYLIKHKSGSQTERFGVGIDNLVFDGEGNLWAFQDGGRNHIWVVRPDHTPAKPKIEIFGTVPIGAEPTGLTFTPDFRYGFFSIQHPSGGNTLSQKDASGENIVHNAPTTIVFARKEHLGNSSVELASKSNLILTGEKPDLLDVDMEVQVYPNPFTRNTMINFQLMEESHVNIELFSISGIKIETLNNQILSPGLHSFEIGTKEQLDFGIYLLRLTKDEQVITKRLIHVRD